MSRLLLALSLLLAAPAAAAQAPASAGPAPRLLLLPISGTNVHPGYLEAAQDIFTDHLLATGRFYVIALPGPAGTAETPSDQAMERGRQASADLVAVTHLARLSGTGRLRLVVYRVAGGGMVHADSIGIAGGPDDLDPALKRLAVGLASGKPSSQTGEIDTVTQREADPYLKEAATRSFGIRLGTLVPLNRPGDLDAVPVPGVGVFWMYDARSFLAEVALDLHSAEDATAFSVLLGGYYPLGRGNFTPYLGTSVAYSFVDLGGEGARGLRLQPALGVLFGRLSTVQFRGEVGYFLNTFGERAADLTGAVTGPRHYAHGPQLTVGLGF